MSDTIVVMKDGTIQQIGDPKTIYDEPANAFVADFIGESNLLRGTMIHDELVEFAGTEFPCVDFGFGENTPVDVVVRPEDIMLVGEDVGQMVGTIKSVLFNWQEHHPNYPDGVQDNTHLSDTGAVRMAQIALTLLEEAQ